jgi:Domain of unknown function (DUF4402)
VKLMLLPSRRRLISIAGEISVATVALSAGELQAGARANTMGEATAVVVSRLSLIKTQDLDFGRIVSTASAGTVTIAPSGSRSKAGGVVLAGAGGQPAVFAGYGLPNQTVSISVSASSYLLVRQGGSETMRIDTLIIGSNPHTQLTTRAQSFRIASSSGMFAFPVGATLRVGARQVQGIYRGNFLVTISYQ